MRDRRTGWKQDEDLGRAIPWSRYAAQIVVVSTASVGTLEFSAEGSTARACHAPPSHRLPWRAGYAGEKHPLDRRGPVLGASADAPKVITGVRALTCRIRP